MPGRLLSWLVSGETVKGKPLVSQKRKFVSRSMPGKRPGMQVATYPVSERANNHVQVVFHRRPALWLDNLWMAFLNHSIPPMDQGVDTATKELSCREEGIVGCIIVSNVPDPEPPCP